MISYQLYCVSQIVKKKAKRYCGHPSILSGIGAYKGWVREWSHAVPW